MANRFSQPLLVHTQVRGQGDRLTVNPDDVPRASRVAIAGFSPSKPSAEVERIAGPLDLANTAAEPDRIVPRRSEWTHDLAGGRASSTFPPRSIMLIRLE